MIRKFLKAGALAALLLLSACGSESEYTNALPRNASMMVAVEVDDMARKAKLDSKEGDAAARKLKALLKGGLQGEATQLAERIIDHPSESGLSFTDKVYCFTTPHAEAFGIVAKVAHESKVEALFEVLAKENIASPLKEESGCRWAQAGKALCAFDDGSFLMLYPSRGDAMSMKATLLSLMRQQAGEGFAALPEFGRIEAEGQDIAAVVNFNAIPRNMTTALRMGLSADIRLEDIKYFVSASFEQGKVVVKSESLIQNPQIQHFFDAMDGMTQPLQGNLLDLYRGNTLVWAGGNVKGKELYDMLRRNPTIRQKLDNPPLPVDVESIFSAIDGDVAIGVNSLYSGEFMLYADVNNSRFLQTFEDLRPMLALTGGQITLDTVGKDEYLMRTYYGSFWFGVKNKRLYVTTNRTLAEEAGRTYGASLGVKPWADEVRQNRLFASANMSSLNGMIPAFVASVHGGMPDWRQGSVEIVLKDKQGNLLQSLVAMMENL